MERYDLVIVGGGPAGLAAAISAYDAGCRSMLMLERDRERGGILGQCIHNGFGLHTFGEELTGPEYAQRYIQELKKREIPHRLGTMVVDISPDKVITAISGERGLQEIAAKAIVLAMGCRERSRGALSIPGYRPAGVYSAGTAQRLVNIEGKLPGRRVVILGSGDIGLIMARRMVLEGAQVEAVVELMPFSGGLVRNIVQCLDDFSIPLLLSHTVTDIQGKRRVEGVTVAQVDENRQPIQGTERHFDCDTLLLSCGLIPENELSFGMGVKINPITNGPTVSDDLQTCIDGVFAAGNVLHVHDLVDFVSEEAALAGRSAVAYINAPHCSPGRRQDVEITCHGAVRYTVPSSVRVDEVNEDIVVRFRVSEVLKNCYVNVKLDGSSVIHKRHLVMVPGEMQEFKLMAKKLREHPQLSKIDVYIEGGAQ